MPWLIFRAFSLPAQTDSVPRVGNGAGSLLTLGQWDVPFRAAFPAMPGLTLTSLKPDTSALHVQRTHMERFPQGFPGS